MKYKYETPTGMVVEVTNADTEMRDKLIEHIREKERAEREAFYEEVRVTLRKLKPGEKVHLESRPITVDLEWLPEQPETQEVKHE